MLHVADIFFNIFFMAINNMHICKTSYKVKMNVKNITLLNAILVMLSSAMRKFLNKWRLD